jgi:ABC-type uncharacterized transport system substrate-binding protein
MTNIHLYTSIVWCFLLFACNTEQKQEKTGIKKIFYLNSYHPAYGTSGQILGGIKKSLKGHEVELQVFYLDAKRIRNEDSLAQKVVQAIQQVEAFSPDIIIASDDDAVKRVVVPHLKGKDVPVVFCGVNWSAAPYGLPSGNVTGMVEVVPVAETITAIRRYYPDIRTLHVLSENTISEEKNKQYLDTAFRRMGLHTEYLLVDDYTAWRQKFKEANQKADLIYLPTNGGIKGWQADNAVQFIAAHIRKPVITCDDFMMKYAVIGLTKVTGEQGEWAGKTALDILNGKPVGQIELAKNTRTQAWYNPYLAQKINFSPDSVFIQSSKVISNPSNLSLYDY